MDAKAAGKRTKSRGLGRLKFFCQMCQKQCRDDNGFKCHTLSEGHLRQMELFRQNPGKMMDEFSNNFERGFVKLLSMRWRSKTANANQVYNEFIKDKQHVHMNSTKWESLTTFARYLGQTGKATVIENEKGLQLRWIDPEVKEREAEQASKERLKARMQEKKKANLKRKMEIMRQMDLTQNVPSHVPSALQNHLKPVEVVRSVNNSSGTNKRRKSAQGSIGSVLLQAEDRVLEPSVDAEKKPAPGPTSLLPEGSTGSATASKSTPGASSVPQKEAEEAWLAKGIVVRILDKTIGDGKYYRKKGVVKKVVDRFGAKLKMDGGEKLVLDQQALETVIPKPKNKCRVRLLKGPMKGMYGILVDLDISNFKGVVALEQGMTVKLEYDAFSKCPAP